MASRYWVGGGSSTNWSATGNTNWAATSGGAGNQSVPGATDDVFFDGNSGSGTSVLSAVTNIQSLDCTGYAGTLHFNTSATLQISGVNGKLKLNNTMIFTTGSPQTTFFNAASGTNQLTSAGQSFDYFQVTNSATVQLQDDMSVSKSIDHYDGTLDMNGHNITVRNFMGTGNGAAHLKLSTGTMTITGDNTTDVYTCALYSNDGNYYVDTNTGTIKFTSTANTQTYFTSAVQTSLPNTIWRTGSGTGAFSFQADPGTYATLKDDSSIAHNWQFISSTVYTISSAGGWLLNGASCSQKLTINASTPGSATLIHCASGTVTSDYVNIKDSNVSGGATFNATHATNVSGNTNWNFLSICSPVNTGAFFNFF